MSEQTHDPQTLFDVKEMELNFGPQHPSTHGVLRLKLKVDGERIIDCYPIIGYLHRGTEKLFELHPFFQNVPHTDRMDYVAAATNNLAYVRCGGEAHRDRRAAAGTLSSAPSCASCSGISSHLLWLATHAIDIGAMTPFFYCFREREIILDLFEEYCGARLTLNCMRPGGLPYDVPVGWVDRCRAFVDVFPEKIDEYEGLLTENRIWKKRTIGIGVHDSGETAIDWGLTGPMVRGSGVAWDLRKAMPYEAYDDVDFDIRGAGGRHLRPLPGAHGGDAPGQPHRGAVPRPATRRSGDGQEAARDQGAQGERGLLLGRGAEGRDRLLHGGQAARPIPTAATCARRPSSTLQALPEMTQNHLLADLVAHHRHDRHRARGGRPMMPPESRHAGGAVISKVWVRPSRCLIRSSCSCSAACCR